MSSLDARPDDENLSYIQKVIFDVGNTISQESVVKMIFLFSDLISEEQFQLLLSTDVSICHRMFCVIKIVLRWKKLHARLALNVWAELLFLTKNYCFLKTLGTCKHEMKDHMLRGESLFSSEFRRLLVSLSDDLTNEEVQYIWGRLYPGNVDYPDQPELLFHRMIAERLIREDSIRELLVHFGVLKRPDLLSRTEDYLKKADMLLGRSAQYDLELDGNFRYCGIAHIFNNKTFKGIPPPDLLELAVKTLEDREGTDRDAERLQKLWESFGIQAFIHNNTDTLAFEKTFIDCLAGDLSWVKIVIICILTHGNQGLVFCADRVPVEIADIEHLLGTNEKLAGKPKLLFVQACQGNHVQRQGKSKSIAESFQFDVRSRDSSEEERPVPQFSDMLIGLSTVPGFMSIRSKTEGSHFIQTLVDVLEDSGDKQDVLSLIKDINCGVASKWVDYTHKKVTHRLAQMPDFHYRLTKGLRFRRATSVLQPPRT